MKKLLLMSIAFCFLPFLAFSQETLTITTYYPAPYGVYTNLRLFPSAQPACTIHEEGTMFYNSGSHQVMVCGLNSTGGYSWQGVGLWTRTGNDVYLADAGWNVGIGTSNPQAPLQVNGEVKIGSSGLLCNATAKGAMRYNNNSSEIQYCNGASWSSVGGGSFGGCYSGYVVNFWPVNNPFTGKQTCPAGYSQEQVVPYPMSAAFWVNCCYKK